MKIPKVDTHCPSKLTHILDSDDDWLELDNGKYFGSDWWPLIKERYIQEGEYCE